MTCFEGTGGLRTFTLSAYIIFFLEEELNLESYSWTMHEQSLPLDIGFAPWTRRTGSRSTLSAAARQLLQQVASSEINQDYNAQTNLDSMYFSGKALAKFAMIVCKCFRRFNCLF